MSLFQIFKSMPLCETNSFTRKYEYFFIQHTEDKQTLAFRHNNIKREVSKNSFKQLEKSCMSFICEILMKLNIL